jgi:hypothetical protein
MRQSIAELGKDIAALKAGLERMNGSAHSQVAKITARLNHAAAEVTGSIAASQTIQTILPPPLPKAAPRAAASEIRAPVRLTVVLGWPIRDARDGYVYLENHADVFWVASGAPLSSLGPVQAIRLQEGR